MLNFYYNNNKDDFNGQVKIIFTTKTGYWPEVGDINAESIKMMFDACIESDIHSDDEQHQFISSQDNNNEITVLQYESEDLQDAISLLIDIKERINEDNYSYMILSPGFDFFYKYIGKNMPKDNSKYVVYSSVNCENMVFNTKKEAEVYLVNEAKKIAKRDDFRGILIASEIHTEEEYIQEIIDDIQGYRNFVNKITSVFEGAEHKTQSELSQELAKILDTDEMEVHFVDSSEEPEFKKVPKKIIN